MKKHDEIYLHHIHCKTFFPYTRMMRAMWNKSWRQHPTKQQLYSHLPPITKTIQVRRNGHAGHCWCSREELIDDMLLWTQFRDEQRQDDQLEPIYNSFVPIQNIALKTSRERWMIWGVAGRGQRDPFWRCDMMMMMMIKSLNNVLFWGKFNSPKKDLKYIGNK